MTARHPAIPRVLLHFHPDWPFGNDSVIESIAKDGRYRSQFETGTSNGGLTAHPGGHRWQWESRLFGGEYDDASAHARPVYGAVDVGDSYGAAARFGSAHLRLWPDVSARSSFCYPDSAFEPHEVVGVDEVAALLARMQVGRLDDLDRYVEAHVHGGVDIARDVEAVVLDPCFRDTAVHTAADRLGCSVEFHTGYRAASQDLDSEYRGAEYVVMAQSLATQLEPDVIGAAARAGTHDAQSLSVFGICSRASGVCTDTQTGA